MKLLKRVMLTFLLAIGTGFLVFGPRPGQSLPADRVIVEYWEKWTGNEGDAMKRSVADFNDSVGREKGIYVRYLSMSNIDQKTLAACAAGVPPDVAGLIQRQIVQFSALGVLEPLDDLARSHGITADLYKPIYWESCNDQSHLWCLISTPGVVALHYNRGVFRQNAAALRGAGLDPDRPPRTIAELDAYSRVLDTYGPDGSLDRVGHLPMIPGWYLDYTFYWFGGDIFDPSTQRFTLASPQNIACYEWLRSYSLRLGKGPMQKFRGGVGKQFDTPQNPFISEKVAMEQQGPWLAGFIYNLTKRAEPWRPSMSEALVPRSQEGQLPNRRENYRWAAAPFPSAVPGLENVTFVDFDALVIPHGARHPREAFEFIAYVNRQDVMERLCKLHCKNSPLRAVSRDFLEHHPNPYIEVFESLAASPHARALPHVPIWPEAHKELDDAAQSVYLLDAEPREALQRAQDHLQAKIDRFRERERLRNFSNAH